MTLISAHDLSFSRGPRRILDKVSLSIQEAEWTTLVGPNGAGKSTLLKVLMGLLEASEGHVTRMPGLRMGYVPQKLSLDSSLPLTVARFLQAAILKPLPVTKWLAQVGAENLENMSMHTLSGGELQRVLLARALMNSPQLLILDEPLQGVDVQGQHRLNALLKELLSQTGAAVLVVSHDLHFVQAHSDQVLCLNGHICCSGKPEEVRRNATYQKLFGEDLPMMAPYTHHHDHDHELCP